MTRHEEMEKKDYEAIEELQKAAEIAREHAPGAVMVSNDGEYTIVKFPSVDGHSREIKVHKPGTCLEPER